MEEQRIDAADERSRLRKNIFLPVRYCAFIGPSRNAEIVLHVLSEVERLKARYRALDAARAADSGGGAVR